LSEEFRRRHLSDPASVPLKKLFYTLRPAAAIRWLARHPEAAVAPMHFPTLMAESELANSAPARYRSRSPLSSIKNWNGHGLKAARRSPSQRREQHAMCEAFFFETVGRFD
jgi:predicted nucleotidyltransferase